MAKLYFEDIHRATQDYPYLDLLMKNINYISHVHEEIEVIYVVFGRTKIIADGKEYELSCGDIYVVMPGIIHSFVSEAENRIYIMKFRVNSELSLLRIAGKITEGNRNYKKIKSAIETIAIEDTMRNTGYKYMVNAQVNLLLLCVVRDFGAISVSVAEQKEAERKLVFLNQVNIYLEEHYRNNISLDDVSKFCHYSKYYFAHMFRDVAAMSFVEFLTIFRLEKSKSLLLSNKSITEIAMDCGFNNLRSFNRAFMKYYGTTPGKYKKQL